MINRRSILALLGLSGVVAPAGVVGASQAKPDRRFIDMPTDPHARLIRRRWMFEQCAAHKWSFDPGRAGYSYAGCGWVGDRPPAHSDVYEYMHVGGDGETAVDAIDDWFGRLPTNYVHAIIWRTEPELTSEFNFDTKRTRYRVYSRFALIPQGSA